MLLLHASVQQSWSFVNNCNSIKKIPYIRNNNYKIKTCSLELYFPNPKHISYRNNICSVFNKEKRYILKNHQQRAQTKIKQTQQALHCIKVINTQEHEGYLVEYKHFLSTIVPHLKCSGLLV